MVSRLDFQDIVRQLDELSLKGDPSDPKFRTRARILRSAASLFEQLGYRRTTIDEVARESGISKGSVYLHFKSKAELLYFAIVEEKKRLIGRFQSLFESPLPPDERLQRYLALLLVTISESPLSRKLLTGDRELVLFMEELPEELQARFAAQQEAGVATLLGGVGAMEGLSAEERDLRQRAFAGILFSIGHLEAARAQTGLSVEQYSRQLAKILVCGLGAA